MSFSVYWIAIGSKFIEDETINQDFVTGVAYFQLLCDNSVTGERNRCNVGFNHYRLHEMKYVYWIYPV